MHAMGDKDASWNVHDSNPLLRLDPDGRDASRRGACPPALSWRTPPCRMSRALGLAVGASLPCIVLMLHQRHPLLAGAGPAQALPRLGVEEAEDPGGREGRRAPHVAKGAGPGAAGSTGARKQERRSGGVPVAREDRAGRRSPKEATTRASTALRPVQLKLTFGAAASKRKAAHDRARGSKAPPQVPARAPGGCDVFDGWRKSYVSGAGVSLDLEGGVYGERAGSWGSCMELCARNGECQQVVFHKETNACYATSSAGDEDIDGRGGENELYISAHCNGAQATQPASAAPGGAPAPPLAPAAPSAAAAPAASPTSLFCFSLLTPWTGDGALLELQLARHAGIFDCEETTVYSNPAERYGSVDTKLVDIDLHCDRGGAWNTLMNTPVFAKLWATILEDGQYSQHAWTVKADADTVFLPGRLRAILSSEEDPDAAQVGNGLFLNNCMFGLHGPLEVVSRRALEVYWGGHDGCGLPVEEDVYLRSCLQQLGVPQKDAFDILDELDCRRDGIVQSPAWHACASGHAAFHPFKTPQEYGECLDRAT